MKYLDTTSGTLMVELITNHINHLRGLKVQLDPIEVDPEFYNLTKKTRYGIIGLYLNHSLEGLNSNFDMEFITEASDSIQRMIVDQLARRFIDGQKDNDNAGKIMSHAINVLMGLETSICTYYDLKFLKDLINEVIDYIVAQEKEAANEMEPA